MQISDARDVDPDLFRPASDLKPGVPAQLFSRYVRNLNLEVFDYCNRQCSYCPVSKVDRRSGVRPMQPGQLSAITSELAALEYSGSICLNLFNEPLASELTFDAIARFRRDVPNARIWFTTNGDYLDRDLVAKIANAGVSRVVISLHFQPGETYDDCLQLTRVSQLSARSGLAFKFVKFRPGTDFKAQARYKSVPFVLKSVDYMGHGVNRAELLDEIPVCAERSSPCDRPFHELAIGWNGAVYPCCQFFPDAPDHDRYIAGWIGRQSLVDIYAGEMLAGFRRDNFGYGSKLAPCNTCGDRDHCRGDADRAIRSEVETMLGL